MLFFNFSKKFPFFSTFLFFLSSVGLFGVVPGLFSANFGSSTTHQVVLAAENPPFVFTRDLKVGSVGPDVRALQQILNTNSVTIVANNGLGSPSNETEYFGELTKWAVVAFQEMYSAEILAPSGLSSGTGFVGPATRAKLNQLSVSGAHKTTSIGNSGGISGVSGILPTQTTENPANSAPVSNNSLLSSVFPQKISLYSASVYQVAPGGSVSLSGSGFPTKESYLQLSNGAGSVRSVTLSPSLNSTRLDFTVPSDLVPGKYELWITRNENESVSVSSFDSSRNTNVPVYIFVSTNPLPSPTISSISPSSVTLEEEIVISGSGFTSGGNNIYSTLGNISNVSSSGGTIRLKASSFPGSGSLRRMPGAATTEVGVWLYVQNENGVNNTPSSFKIRI